MPARAVLTFRGHIGAGKTTFIRTLLRALGITGPIKSPTFSLVESYVYGDKLFHHFDLYRIQDETELEYIGFRDYFVEQSVCCIEWPERLPDNFVNSDLDFSLNLKDGQRTMIITALSAVGKKMMSCCMSKR